MAIWKREFDLAQLNATSANTLIEYLSIQYTDFNEKSLTASVNVDPRLHQPLGMLHGGASVVLAETVASLAANLCVEETHYCVGLEINANHIKPVRSGMIFAVATPLHLGVKTQIWQIEIRNEQKQLICVSRFTVAVLDK